MPSTRADHVTEETVKIFVLGSSRTGKSPFARKVAEARNIPTYGASAWVRERFPAAAAATTTPTATTTSDRAAFVEAITAFSIAELRRDPAISIDHLRRRADLSAPCVIEGMRNPYDFVSCFDLRTDRVVELIYTGDDALTPTAFERGLDVIRDYLAWLRGAGLLDEGRVTTYRFDTFDELDALVDTYLATLPDPPAATTAPTSLDDSLGRPSNVHADIPPIRTHVRAEYLYGMDPSHLGELRPCTAFSISSYAGSAPTFQIVLPDGALFSYVPPSALVDPTRAASSVVAPLELSDLVYHDCKTTPISVHTFGALAGPVLCLIKRTGEWLRGTYLFTIDWYTSNEMLHAIALDNGQYALLPNHKIKFGDHEPGFEPYKKIRRDWRVE